MLESTQNTLPKPVLALLEIGTLLQQTSGGALHFELVLSDVHLRVQFHLLQAL